MSKSPMLKSAIVKALKKSCHSQAISRLFSKIALSTQHQFMRFVSSHTKEGNDLIGFHPSSFVISWTDLKYSNTIVVCTLTSLHHILSNLQDRLLQLGQIFQYLHHNIKFQLLITDEVVGDDVTLQYWSWLAYSTMGFDTTTLTQDCIDIGCFRIKMDYLIPMFQYGNLFTWEKYGYIILHPDLTCTVLSGLDKTYCKTITRGSGPKIVIFSNGPKIISECSNPLC